MLSVEQEGDKAAAEVVRQCPKWDGKPLTVAVKETFPEGSQVRDFYSGNIATVTQGKITLDARARQQRASAAGTGAESSAQAAFNWHNATVYFVLTDRFVNGDPTNDNSYGRHKDGMQEIAPFTAAISEATSKLDYLQTLGVNAYG